MKKITIFYATAGIGHKKAALAIEDAFRRAGKEDVIAKDALDYTNAFFKKSYNAIYLFLIRYVPTIWGLCYYLLDNRFIYALVRPMRRLTNRLNCADLVRFMRENRPDAVIVTHFLSLEVIADLKKKNIVDSRLIAVVTDYRPHNFWVSGHVDLYIVAADYTKDDLVARGISPEKIRVLGIPCGKSFSEERDTRALRLKLGLEPDKRTVFVLGGGFGVGPIKKLVLNLDKSERDFQCITVCGYNKKLYETISEIAKSAAHKFKVYGFVNNVDEFMAASDILVSKPGGITVTEALNAGLPMVVVSPIPGQEMRNYKFLEKHNAALKIRNASEITKAIDDVFGPSVLDNLRENVKRIRLAGSADHIRDAATG